jgi:hypothetical protein
VQADPTTRRILYFEGANLIGSLPPDIGMFAFEFGLVVGADGSGAFYAVQSPRLGTLGPRDIGPDDSLAMVRIRANARTMDTVAMLRDAPGRVHSRRDSEGKLRPYAISRPAMATSELFAVFQDGWIAIARLDPYRIDWIDPSMRVRIGPSIPSPERAFDGPTRDAYLAKNARTIEELESAPPEMRAVLMSRFTEFPERVPPFEPTSLVAGTDGRLYLRLAEPGLAARTAYHVIDRSGTLIEFSLVANARVVSASERFIYVVERDSLGLEHLKRYANRLSSRGL